MNRTTNKKGFSLVELLAVVLVLAALAAIAVPLYTSQRKSAQARVCLANLSAISASLSAFALRNNEYPQVALTTAYTAGAPDTSGLIGAPEGLAQIPVCPASGTAYAYTVATGTTVTPSICKIACPVPANHTGYAPAGAVYTITMPIPAADSLP